MKMYIVIYMMVHNVGWMPNAFMNLNMTIQHVSATKALLEMDLNVKNFIKPSTSQTAQGIVSVLMMKNV